MKTKIKTKSILKLILFSFILGLTSCVDILSFDEVDESHIFVNCELIKGSPNVVATISTSNNLNGTQPISVPESAIVELSLGTETPLRLWYNSKDQQFVNSNDLDWSQVAKFELNVNIPESNIENVKSNVEVLKANTIDTILASKVVEVEIGEDIFYKREVTIVFDPPSELPAYYELNFSEKLTVSNNGILTEIGDFEEINEIEFESGGFGVVDMKHKNGLLIDQSRLVDDELTFTMTSAFPIELDNQSFSKVKTNLGSISKTYYDYHKAKSNSYNRDEGVLIDRTIWGSNIENGFGLFSSTTPSIQEFQF